MLRTTSAHFPFWPESKRSDSFLACPKQRGFLAADLIQKPLIGDRAAAVESLLRNLEIAPDLPRLLADLLAPCRDAGVFMGDVLILPSFGLDDPVDLASGCLLNGHEVGVVETNGAVGAQIIDTEAGVRFGQGGKAQDVFGVIEKQSKAPLLLTYR